MNVISLLKKHNIDPALILTKRKIWLTNRINKSTDDDDVKLLVINENGIFDIRYDFYQKLSPKLFEICYPWTFYSNLPEFYGLNQEVDKYIEDNSIDLIVRSIKYDYNFVILRKKYKKKQTIVNFKNEITINKCVFLSSNFQTIHSIYYNKFILSNDSEYFEYSWGIDKVRYNKDCKLIINLLDKGDCEVSFHLNKLDRYAILEFD